jgi:hypothetical protein
VNQPLGRPCVPALANRLRGGGYCLHEAAG